MSDRYKDDVELLNDPQETVRIAALERLSDDRDVTATPFTEEVNNHVHTRYSFSPYSPAAVAYYARRAGLRVVGSVDHESIAGAGEMKRAAAIAGIGSTVGCEIRVDFAGTPFEERRLNNPDTIGNGYIVIHGVPERSWEPLAAHLRPLNAARERRNRKQLEGLNTLIAGELGTLEYDRDVRALSWAHNGGSVTERHILFALARRVIDAVPDPGKTAIFLTERFSIEVPVSAQQRINDPTNPHRAYDLLGVFKAEFVQQFFIQPDREECPPVTEMAALARELGAIPAYSYLGDVGESPTGDKKAQQFEDEYVDELFASLRDLGFLAVTYMPPRNTKEQLLRIQELARRYELLEISGVDINSSRQSFHCPEVLQPEFRHLGETTWALVGHEAAAKDDRDRGFFGPSGGTGSLTERIARFAELGKRSTPAGADLL
ncbi:MAG: PHP domain-containing protein [Alkalispirochaeta sp.]